MRYQEYNGNVQYCMACHTRCAGGARRTVKQLYTLSGTHFISCIDCLPSVLSKYESICIICHKKFFSFAEGPYRYICGCFCLPDNFLWQEYKRIHQSDTRARIMGRPATLTLTDWIVTLLDFSLLCAYCQKAPFKELDHFIPLSTGGDTTINNCVPACRRCNKRKYNFDLDDPRLTVARDNMLRVQRYLQTRTTGDSIQRAQAATA